MQDSALIRDFEKEADFRQVFQRLTRLSTHRASKRHGEAVSPSLSHVLVDLRDARFAAAVREVAALPRRRQGGGGGEGEGDAGGEGGGGTCTTFPGDSGDERAGVVGVFGLVHLDGILEKLG